MAPSKAGHKGGPPGQRLKVVVRKLPPDLPPKVFWQTTAQWITREDTDADADEYPAAERVVWSQYRQGKVRKRCARSSIPRRLPFRSTRSSRLSRPCSGKDKDSVNSRAYITFKTPEALVAFHKGYEGWAFRDKAGPSPFSLSLGTPPLVNPLTLDCALPSNRQPEPGSRRIRAVSAHPDRSRKTGSPRRNHRRRSARTGFPAPSLSV